MPSECPSTRLRHVQLGFNSARLVMVGCGITQYWKGVFAASVRDPLPKLTQAAHSCLIVTRCRVAHQPQRH